MSRLSILPPVKIDSKGRRATNKSRVNSLTVASLTSFHQVVPSSVSTTRVMSDTL